MMLGCPARIQIDRATGRVDTDMSRVTTPFRRLAHIGSLLLCAMLAMSAAASAAVPTLTVSSALRSPIAGMQDDRIPYTSDPAARVRSLADAGASLIRVDLRWDSVARTRPADPTSPGDPAYDWHQYDAIVAAAATYNVEVLFAVYGTPAWAVDSSVKTLPDYEDRFPDSSIRPLSPADFGAFGEAAARRYAPQGVRKWEGWNEPNIALFLQPQYDRVGSRWVAASPATYSALLKAFSAGVQRVDASAVIAGGVTAPAGDLCPNCRSLADPPLRVTPHAFIAALNAPGLRPPMDVVSHHPYPLSAPRAETASGRSYVDLYNLDVLVRAIDKTYLKGKRLWLTEYGFATRAVTEYPIFFTPAKQADYIVDAYRRVKASRRVTMTVYYLLQDHPQWASGVLRQDGTPKPGYQAIGLPFATSTGVTKFARGARVTLVGQSRVGRGAHVVVIERKSGGRWVRLKRVTTSVDGSFRVRLRLTSKIALRAMWTGFAPSGAAATRTSPTVTLTTRR